MVTTTKRMKKNLDDDDDDDGREAMRKERAHEKTKTNSHTELYKRFTCAFLCTGNP
jgi:hypothetical protein